LEHLIAVGADGAKVAAGEIGKSVHCGNGVEIDWAGVRPLHS